MESKKTEKRFKNFLISINLISIIVSAILAALITVSLLEGKYSVASACFVIFVIEIARNIKDRQTNKKLQELKEEAQEANLAKSNFFANMSHEIRTPMNTIKGMSDILLRGELSDKERGHIQDIKQAGNSLISIINDILDFSKIESGKLEINPGKYFFSSLLHDTVSITRMKLIEKSVRFYSNIDSNIPNGLVGDEARLRQIFLNLLSNAIKHTAKGHIGFSISQEKREGNKIWLKITVSDTGHGIKPEHLEKLFDGFTQLDTKKNRSMNGPGLGLAITMRLCRLMGGDITVQSEYGSGSVFTVTIPQEIYLETPFAAVEESDRKKVLLYEGRISYAKSLSWSLENMNVPHTMVTNQESFVEALFSEEWFYVFSGYGLYKKIIPVLEGPAESFPNGKKPPLALMIELGTESYLPGVRFLSIPVQSLSISNILNGKEDSKSYSASDGYNPVRFTLPSARILVVDDIYTNLKVAEGLLAPYQARVDECLSGAEAVEFVKRNNYDLVFMDHMMPDMDGIEATAAIRAWEAEEAASPLTPNSSLPKTPTPIIALTANAVSGVKEMFLENGFSDFLAKPIDISKLDEMLAKWIPREKRSQEVPKPAPAAKEAQSLTIPGVNTVKGLAMTGGKPEFYRKVLSMYIKDTEGRLPKLQSTPNADSLPAFISNTHSLKGVSASIGAAEISAEAAALEAAGKANDINSIEEKLPAFVKKLTELTENIRRALEAE